MKRRPAAAPVPSVGDPERRQWLERLCETCERVLAGEQGVRSDASYARVREDVSDLLARLTAELDAMGR